MPQKRATRTVVRHVSKSPSPVRSTQALKTRVRQEVKPTKHATRRQSRTEVELQMECCDDELSPAQLQAIELAREEHEKANNLIKAARAGNTLVPSSQPNTFTIVPPKPVQATVMTPPPSMLTPPGTPSVHVPDMSAAMMTPPTPDYDYSASRPAPRTQQFLNKQQQIVAKQRVGQQKTASPDLIVLGTSPPTSRPVPAVMQRKIVTTPTSLLAPRGPLGPQQQMVGVTPQQVYKFVSLPGNPPTNPTGSQWLVRPMVAVPPQQQTAQPGPRSPAAVPGRSPLQTGDEINSDCNRGGKINVDGNRGGEINFDGTSGDEINSGHRSGNEISSDCNRGDKINIDGNRGDKINIDANRWGDSELGHTHACSVIKPVDKTEHNILGDLLIKSSCQQNSEYANNTLLGSRKFSKVNKKILSGRLTFVNRCLHSAARKEFFSRAIVCHACVVPRPWLNKTRRKAKAYKKCILYSKLKASHDEYKEFTSDESCRNCDKISDRRRVQGFHRERDMEGIVTSLNLKESSKVINDDLMDTDVSPIGSPLCDICDEEHDIDMYCSGSVLDEKTGQQRTFSACEEELATYSKYSMRSKDDRLSNAFLSAESRGNFELGCSDLERSLTDVSELDEEISHDRRAKSRKRENSSNVKGESYQGSFLSFMKERDHLIGFKETGVIENEEPMDVQHDTIGDDEDRMQENIKSMEKMDCLLKNMEPSQVNAMESADVSHDTVPNSDIEQNNADDASSNVDVEMEAKKVMKESEFMNNNLPSFSINDNNQEFTGKNDSCSERPSLNDGTPESMELTDAGSSVDLIENATKDLVKLNQYCSSGLSADSVGYTVGLSDKSEVVSEINQVEETDAGFDEIKETSERTETKCVKSAVKNDIAVEGKVKDIATIKGTCKVKDVNIKDTCTIEDNVPIKGMCKVNDTVTVKDMCKIQDNVTIKGTCRCGDDSEDSGTWSDCSSDSDAAKIAEKSVLSTNTSDLPGKCQKSGVLGTSVRSLPGTCQNSGVKRYKQLSVGDICSVVKLCNCNGWSQMSRILRIPKTQLLRWKREIRKAKIDIGVNEKRTKKHSYREDVRRKSLSLSSFDDGHNQGDDRVEKIDISSEELEPCQLISLHSTEYCMDMMDIDMIECDMKGNRTEFLKGDGVGDEIFTKETRSDSKEINIEKSNILNVNSGKLREVLKEISGNNGKNESSGMRTRLHSNSNGNISTAKYQTYNVTVSSGLISEQNKKLGHYVKDGDNSDSDNGENKDCGLENLPGSIGRVTPSSDANDTCSLPIVPIEGSLVRLYTNDPMDSSKAVNCPVPIEGSLKRLYRNDPVDVSLMQLYTNDPMDGSLVCLNSSESPIMSKDFRCGTDTCLDPVPTDQGSLVKVSDGISGLLSESNEIPMTNRLDDDPVIQDSSVAFTKVTIVDGAIANTTDVTYKRSVSDLRSCRNSTSPTLSESSSNVLQNDTDKEPPTTTSGKSSKQSSGKSATVIDTINEMELSEPVPLEHSLVKASNRITVHSEMGPPLDPVSLENSLVKASNRIAVHSEIGPPSGPVPIEGSLVRALDWEVVLNETDPVLEPVLIPNSLVYNSDRAVVSNEMEMATKPVPIPNSLVRVLDGEIVLDEMEPASEPVSIPPNSLVRASHGAVVPNETSTEPVPIPNSLVRVSDGEIVLDEMEPASEPVPIPPNSLVRASDGVVVPNETLTEPVPLPNSLVRVSDGAVVLNEMETSTEPVPIPNSLVRVSDGKIVLDEMEPASEPVPVADSFKWVPDNTAVPNDMEAQLKKCYIDIFVQSEGPNTSKRLEIRYMEKPRKELMTPKGASGTGEDLNKETNDSVRIPEVGSHVRSDCDTSTERNTSNLNQVVSPKFQLDTTIERLKSKLVPPTIEMFDGVKDRCEGNGSSSVSADSDTLSCTDADRASGSDQDDLDDDGANEVADDSESCDKEPVVDQGFGNLGSGRPGISEDQDGMMGMNEDQGQTCDSGAQSLLDHSYVSVDKTPICLDSADTSENTSMVTENREGNIDEHVDGVDWTPLSLDATTSYGQDEWTSLNGRRVRVFKSFTYDQIWRMEKTLIEEGWDRVASKFDIPVNYARNIIREAASDRKHRHYIRKQCKVVGRVEDKGIHESGNDHCQRTNVPSSSHSIGNTMNIHLPSVTLDCLMTCPISWCSESCCQDACARAIERADILIKKVLVTTKNLGKFARIFPVECRTLVGMLCYKLGKTEVCDRFKDLKKGTINVWAAVWKDAFLKGPQESDNDRCRTTHGPNASHLTGDPSNDQCQWMNGPNASHSTGDPSNDHCQWINGQSASHSTGDPGIDRCQRTNDPSARHPTGDPIFIHLPSVSLDCLMCPILWCSEPCCEDACARAIERTDVLINEVLVRLKKSGKSTKSLRLPGECRNLVGMLCYRLGKAEVCDRFKDLKKGTVDVWAAVWKETFLKGPQESDNDRCRTTNVPNASHLTGDPSNDQCQWMNGQSASHSTGDPSNDQCQRINGQSASHCTGDPSNDQCQRINGQSASHSTGDPIFIHLPSVTLDCLTTCPIPRCSEPCCVDACARAIERADVLINEVLVRLKKSGKPTKRLELPGECRNLIGMLGCELGVAEVCDRFKVLKKRTVKLWEAAWKDAFLKGSQEILNDPSSSGSIGDPMYIHLPKVSFECLMCPISWCSEPCCQDACTKAIERADFLIKEELECSKNSGKAFKKFSVECRNLVGMLGYKLGVTQVCDRFQDIKKGTVNNWAATWKETFLNIPRKRRVKLSDSVKMKLAFKCLLHGINIISDRSHISKRTLQVWMRNFNDRKMVMSSYKLNDDELDLLSLFTGRQEVVNDAILLSGQRKTPSDNHKDRVPVEKSMSDVVHDNGVSERTQKCSKSHALDYSECLDESERMISGQCTLLESVGLRPADAAKPCLNHSGSSTIISKGDRRESSGETIVIKPLPRQNGGENGNHIADDPSERDEILPSSILSAIDQGAKNVSQCLSDNGDDSCMIVEPSSVFIKPREIKEEPVDEDFDAIENSLQCKTLKSGKENRESTQDCRIEKRMDKDIGDVCYAATDASNEVPINQVGLGNGKDSTQPQSHSNNVLNNSTGTLSSSGHVEAASDTRQGTEYPSDLQAVSAYYQNSLATDHVLVVDPRLTGNTGQTQVPGNLDQTQVLVQDSTSRPGSIVRSMLTGSSGHALSTTARVSMPVSTNSASSAADPRVAGYVGHMLNAVPQHPGPTSATQSVPRHPSPTSATQSVPRHPGPTNTTTQSVFILRHPSATNTTQSIFTPRITGNDGQTVNAVPQFSVENSTNTTQSVVSLKLTGNIGQTFNAASRVSVMSPSSTSRSVVSPRLPADIGQSVNVGSRSVVSPRLPTDIGQSVDVGSWSVVSPRFPADIGQSVNVVSQSMVNPSLPLVSKSQSRGDSLLKPAVSDEQQRVQSPSLGAGIETAQIPPVSPSLIAIPSRGEHDPSEEVSHVPSHYMARPLPPPPPLTLFVTNEALQKQRVMQDMLALRKKQQVHSSEKSTDSPPERQLIVSPSPGLSSSAKPANPPFGRIQSLIKSVTNRINTPSGQLVSDLPENFHAKRTLDLSSGPIQKPTTNRLDGIPVTPDSSVPYTKVTIVDGAIAKTIDTINRSGVSDYSCKNSTSDSPSKSSTYISILQKDKDIGPPSTTSSKSRKQSPGKSAVAVDKERSTGSNVNLSEKLKSLLNADIFNAITDEGTNAANTESDDDLIEILAKSREGKQPSKTSSDKDKEEKQLSKTSLEKEKVNKSERTPEKLQSPDLNEKSKLRVVYSHGLKLKIAKLAQLFSVVSVAKRFQINAKTVSRWKTQFQDDELDDLELTDSEKVEIELAVKTKEAISKIQKSTTGLYDIYIDNPEPESDSEDEDIGPPQTKVGRKKPAILVPKLTYEKSMVKDTAGTSSKVQSGDAQGIPVSTASGLLDKLFSQTSKPRRVGSTSSIQNKARSDVSSLSLSTSVDRIQRSNSESSVNASKSSLKSDMPLYIEVSDVASTDEKLQIRERIKSAKNDQVWPKGVFLESSKRAVNVDVSEDDTEQDLVVVEDSISEYEVLLTPESNSDSLEKILNEREKTPSDVHTAAKENGEDKDSGRHISDQAGMTHVEEKSKMVDRPEVGMSLSLPDEKDMASNTTSNKSIEPVTIESFNVNQDVSVVPTPAIVPEQIEHEHCYNKTPEKCEQVPDVTSPKKVKAQWVSSSPKTDVKTGSGAQPTEQYSYQFRMNVVKEAKKSGFQKTAKWYNISMTEIMRWHDASLNSSPDKAKISDVPISSTHTADFIEPVMPSTAKLDKHMTVPAMDVQASEKVSMTNIVTILPKSSFLQTRQPQSSVDASALLTTDRVAPVPKSSFTQSRHPQSSVDASDSRVTPVPKPSFTQARQPQSTVEASDRVAPVSRSSFTQARQSQPNVGSFNLDDYKADTRGDIGAMPRIVKQASSGAGVEIASTWKQIQTLIHPSKNPGRKFTNEYKNKIIRECEQKGQKAVSKENSIPYNEISRWRLEAKNVKTAAQKPGASAPKTWTPTNKEASSNVMKPVAGYKAPSAQAKASTPEKKQPMKDKTKQSSGEAKSVEKPKSAEKDSLKIRIKIPKPPAKTQPVDIIANKLATATAVSTSSAVNTSKGNTPKAVSTTSGANTPKAVSTTSGTNTPKAVSTTSGTNTPKAVGTTSGANTPKAVGTSSLNTPNTVNEEDGDLRMEVINHCFQFGVLKTQKKYGVTRQSVIDLMKEYDELNKYSVDAYNKSHGLKTKLVSREKTSVEVAMAMTQSPPLVVENLKDYIVTPEYKMEVAEYAKLHGITAATRKYRRKISTVKTWMGFNAKIGRAGIVQPTTIVTTAAVVQPSTIVTTSTVVQPPTIVDVIQPPVIVTTQTDVVQPPVIVTTQTDVVQPPPLWPASVAAAQKRLEIRSQVAQYARMHGSKEAAKKFRKKVATVQGWMSWYVNDQRKKRREEMKMKQDKAADSNKTQSGVQNSGLSNQSETTSKSSQSQKSKTPPQSPIWDQDFVIKPSTDKSSLKLTLSPRRKSPIIRISESDEENDSNGGTDNELGSSFEEFAAWSPSADANKCKDVEVDVPNSKDPVYKDEGEIEQPNKEKDSNNDKFIIDAEDVPNILDMDLVFDVDHEKTVSESIEEDLITKLASDSISDKEIVENSADQANIANRPVGQEGNIQQESDTSANKSIDVEEHLETMVTSSDLGDITVNSGPTSSNLGDITVNSGPVVIDSESEGSVLAASPMKMTSTPKASPERRQNDSAGNNDKVPPNEKADTDKDIVEEKVTENNDNQMLKSVEDNQEKVEMETDEVHSVAEDREGTIDSIPSIPYEETLMFKVFTPDIDKFFNEVFEVSKSKSKADTPDSNMKDGEKTDTVKKVRLNSDLEIMQNLGETCLYGSPRLSKGQDKLKDVNLMPSDTVPEKEIATGDTLETDSDNKDKNQSTPVKKNTEDGIEAEDSGSIPESVFESIKLTTDKGKTESQLTTKKENAESQLTTNEENAENSTCSKDKVEVDPMVDSKSQESHSDGLFGNLMKESDKQTGSPSETPIEKQIGSPSETPIEKSTKSPFNIFGSLMKTLNMPKSVNIKTTPKSDASSTTETPGIISGDEGKDAKMKEKGERNLFDFLLPEPNSAKSDIGKAVESNPSSFKVPVAKPIINSSTPVKKIKPMFKFPKLALPVNFGNIAKLGMAKMREAEKNSSEVVENVSEKVENVSKKVENVAKKVENVSKKVEESLVKDKPDAAESKSSTVETKDSNDTRSDTETKSSHKKEFQQDGKKESSEIQTGVKMETFEELRKRLAQERSANKAEKETLVASKNESIEGVEELKEKESCTKNTEPTSEPADTVDYEMYKEFTPQKIILILDISKKHGLEFAASSFDLPPSVIVDWIIEKDRKHRRVASGVTLENKLLAVRELRQNGDDVRQELATQHAVDPYIVDNWKTEMKWLLDNKDVVDVLEKWQGIESFTSLGLDDNSRTEKKAREGNKKATVAVDAADLNGKMEKKAKDGDKVKATAPVDDTDVKCKVEKKAKEGDKSKATAPVDVAEINGGAENMSKEGDKAKAQVDDTDINGGAENMSKEGVKTKTQVDDTDMNGKAEKNTKEGDINKTIAPEDDTDVNSKVEKKTEEGGESKAIAPVDDTDMKDKSEKAKEEDEAKVPLPADDAVSVNPPTEADSKEFSETQSVDTLDRSAEDLSVEQKPDEAIVVDEPKIPEVLSFTKTLLARDYSTEQKAMLVLLVDKYGVKEVHKRLNINKGTLWTWKHQNRLVKNFLQEQTGTGKAKSVSKTTKDAYVREEQVETRGKTISKAEMTITIPEVIEEPHKGYRLISPTKLPECIRNVKKIPTKDFTLDQRVAIVRLVELYGVRQIHKQFRIPSGSIWNWQHARNVIEKLREEKKREDAANQPSAGTMKSLTFSDTVDEKQQPLCIDLIFDRVLVATEKSNHLDFTAMQKADVVCLVNNFGLNYVLEKVPQIPRGTIWNWCHNKHVLSILEAREKQLRTQKAAKNFKWLDSGSDKIDKTGMTQRWLRACRDSDAGRKRKASPSGVWKIDGTKKARMELTGDGLDTGDLSDASSDSKRDSYEEVDMDNELPVGTKYKAVHGGKGVKGSGDNNDNDDVDSESSISVVSDNSDYEILSDDEINTASCCSKSEISAQNSHASKSSKVLTKNVTKSSPVAAAVANSAGAGKVDLDASIDEPCPVYEVLKTETKEDNRTMVCYKVVKNTDGDSGNKPNQSGQKRPAPDSDLSPPSKKKAGAKAGHETDTTGNWVPLDEYYYGTQDGNPHYAEAKAEYRFKCWYCSKMLYNNVRVMQHIQGHIDSSKQLNIELSDLTQCKHCYKQFDTPFEMQTHVEKVHLSNKVLMCRICEKEMASPRELTHHMRSCHHAGEMPYVCQLCDFRSSMYSDVVDHFKKKHDSSNHLLCLYCLRTFGVKFVSNGWGQTQTYYGHLLKHQSKTQTKKCVTCRLTFFNPADVKTHRRNHHGSNNISKTSVVSANRAGSSQSPVMIKIPESGAAGGKKSGSKLKSLNAPSMKKIQDYGGVKLPRELTKASCLECKIQMSSPDHYKKHINCSLCRFATSCSVAYANHMMGFHSGQMSSLNLNIPWERPQADLMFCVCGFQTKYGNKIANHLVVCSKQTCFSRKPEASSSIGKAANKKDEGQDGSLLGVLGLVQKPGTTSKQTSQLDQVKSETLDNTTGTDTTKRGTKRNVSPAPKMESESKVKTTRSKLDEVRSSAEREVGKTSESGTAESTTTAAPSDDLKSGIKTESDGTKADKEKAETGKEIESIDLEAKANAAEKEKSGENKEMIDEKDKMDNVDSAKMAEEIVSEKNAVDAATAEDIKELEEGSKFEAPVESGAEVVGDIDVENEGKHDDSEMKNKPEDDTQSETITTDEKTNKDIELSVSGDGEELNLEEIDDAEIMADDSMEMGSKVADVSNRAVSEDKMEEAETDLADKEDMDVTEEDKVDIDEGNVESSGKSKELRHDVEDETVGDDELLKEDDESVMPVDDSDAKDEKLDEAEEALIKEADESMLEEKDLESKEIEDVSDEKDATRIEEKSEVENELKRGDTAAEETEMDTGESVEGTDVKVAEDTQEDMEGSTGKGLEEEEIAELNKDATKADAVPEDETKTVSDDGFDVEDDLEEKEEELQESKTDDKYNKQQEQPADETTTVAAKPEAEKDSMQTETTEKKLATDSHAGDTRSTSSHESTPSSHGDHRGDGRGSSSSRDHHRSDERASSGDRRRSDERASSGDRHHGDGRGASSSRDHHQHQDRPHHGDRHDDRYRHDDRSHGSHRSDSHHGNRSDSHHGSKPYDRNRDNRDRWGGSGDYRHSDNRSGYGQNQNYRGQGRGGYHGQQEQYGGYHGNQDRNRGGHQDRDHQDRNYNRNYGNRGGYNQNYRGGYRGGYY